MIARGKFESNESIRDDEKSRLCHLIHLHADYGALRQLLFDS